MIVRDYCWEIEFPDGTVEKVWEVEKEYIRLKTENHQLKAQVSELTKEKAKFINQIGQICAIVCPQQPPDESLE